ncbi:2'-5' RNA ligase family protein [Streptomyces sp. NPDC094154]|uniref:2'-5' RNA ligase family protein n=1 Tax=Streptomyces sp. NPDC094154 TaxID=3366059 RepID=UPI0037F2ED43
MTPTTEMRNHWWWRPGWDVGRRFYTWHCTFDGQNNVHQVAADYRAALAPLGPALTLIPDQWLHLTMQGVAFVNEIAEADVRAIADAARARLAAVPVFDVQLGPAIVDPEAVLLPVSPGDPVQDVRNAVRAAIGDVLGEVPEKADGFRPHVSVAYSAAEGSAEPVAKALTAVAGTSARARISTADLIVIHRDNKMYEWEPYASVPLG